MKRLVFFFGLRVTDYYFVFVASTAYKVRSFIWSHNASVQYSYRQRGGELR